MVLCGFGKGRFKSGEPDGDNEVQFLCDSPDSLAIMDGVCKSLGEFLTEKRQSTPDKPPLCYYAATFSPDDNTWTLKKVSGRMFCNIFFLSCSPFHLFNQPFHCPFIQLVLVCPRKTMSPFLLQWMNRRMLRVHVPRHVLV